MDGNYRSISQAGEILVTDELERVGTMVQGKPSTLLIFDWVRRHGMAGRLGHGSRTKRVLSGIMMIRPSIRPPGCYLWLIILMISFLMIQSFDLL